MFRVRKLDLSNASAQSRIQVERHAVVLPTKISFDIISDYELELCACDIGEVDRPAIEGLSWFPF